MSGCIRPAGRRIGGTALGSGRLRSAWLPWLGLARVCLARLGSAWCGSAWLGLAALLGAARLGFTRNKTPDKQNADSTQDMEARTIKMLMSSTFPKTFFFLIFIFSEISKTAKIKILGAEQFHERKTRRRKVTKLATCKFYGFALPFLYLCFVCTSNLEKREKGWNCEHASNSK